MEIHTSQFDLGLDVRVTPWVASKIMKPFRWGSSSCGCDIWLGARCLVSVGLQVE